MPQPWLAICIICGFFVLIVGGGTLAAWILDRGPYGGWMK